MSSHEPSIVYVRGCARSGTTLLSDILNEHPSIAILVEEPLGSLANRLLDIFWFERHRHEQRDAVAAMTAKQKAHEKREHYAPIENPERMRYPRRYPMRDRFSTILTSVVEASLEKSPLDVMGSKTPGHWNDHEVRMVRDLYGPSKSVFVVRNPHDTINSIVNRRNAARKGLDLWPDKPVEEAVSRYREGICLLLSCAAADPQNTFAVGYDDLIARTESTLSALGEFLSVDLRDRSNLIKESRPARNVMTRDEEKFVRNELGPAIESWKEKRLTGLATNLGYTLDDCIATAQAREQYRFDAPVGERGVLGAGWSGAEPQGIWSDAEASDIWFAVPKDAGYVIDLQLAGHLNDRRKPLSFSTTIADTTAHHTLRNDRNVRLRLGPVQLEAARAHRLRFDFPPLQSALEAGTGTDPRRKGVRIRRLAIQKG